MSSPLPNRVTANPTRHAEPVRDEAALAGAVLTIDLTAIVANWCLLAARAAPAICAAVVKADAYGLGAARVGAALCRAGCDTFFVAHADEGVALRAALGPAPTIAVLHGQTPGAEAILAAEGLVPVLSAPWQIAAWNALAARLVRRLDAMIQVDSGMTRFGLAEGEIAALAPDAFAGMNLRLVMSHLACADEPDHPANAHQLAAFRRLAAQLPAAPWSLAASSGVFLGPDYAFDLVRPGAALYGIAPQPGRPNPLRPVLRLQAKVVQLRDVPGGVPVGYGWTQATTAPARLATLSIGYADGLPRSLSGRGAAWRDGVRLPFMGRVSMDSIVVDASASDALAPGDLVDLIGPDQDADALARDSGTIGYEILTGLGGRFHRVYREA